MTELVARAERVQRAEQLLDQRLSDVGGQYEDAITDLLADILAFAADSGYDMAWCLDQAQGLWWE